MSHIFQPAVYCLLSNDFGMAGAHSQGALDGLAEELGQPPAPGCYPGVRKRDRPTFS